MSYLSDPDAIFARNLARANVKNLIAGPSKILAGEHAAFQLARPLERLGLYLTETAATLHPSVADREFAGRFLQSEALVAIHPGSGSESKNWPIARWQEIGEWMLGHARSLLVIGGEGDRRQLQFLRAAWGERAVLFAENLPLPQLAAVIEKCALFLGHDSGISHIAAAVGTPCLLLFGPSDPLVWAPANANVRVLRAPNGNLADLQQRDVRAELPFPATDDEGAA